MKKRLLSTILALSMMLTILPFNAITAFADRIYEGSGYTGDFTGPDGTNIQYTSSEYGKLHYSITEEPTGENSGKVSVTGWRGPEKNQEVIIPKTVENDGNTYTVTAIAKEAFQYVKVKKVTIPDTVISIGEKAFYGSYVTEVTIPSSVQTIGELAFYQCKKMTNLTIENGVSSIGKQAFYECTGLTSVTIPSSVISMGEQTFRLCSGLTSIDIKNSVIGDSAFSECTGLTSVTIPASVTTMGESAFSKCTGLISVTIQNSVIGDKAFEGCTELTSATLQKGVTSIGANAFSSDCKLHEVELPSTLKTIGSYAFFASGLMSVSIPNGVINIGEHAFQSTQLKTVNIPESVTSIGSFAFSDCTALESAYLLSNITYFPYGIFQNCTKLKTVNIPNQVETIGQYAFCNCKSLKLEDTTLPNSLKYIYNCAFSGCSGLGLKEITLPEATNTISSDAFKGCTELEKIYYPHLLSTLKQHRYNISGLSIATDENENATITYDGQDPIPVLYQCTVNLWPGEGSMAEADKKILVYHTEKVLDTKANNLTNLTKLPEPTAPSGQEFTGWYTDNTRKDETTKFNVDTPITKDMYLYAGYAVERKTITLPPNVTATVDGETVTIDSNNQIKAAPNSEVVLTVSDSTYDPNCNYTWSGIDGTPSGEHNKTFTFTVGNSDVDVTLASALRKQKFTVTDDVTVTVDGNEIQPGTDGKYEVELTKDVTLTVKDPKYGDTYKWSVNGEENTKDVTNDGKTLTLTVDDQLNTIALATTKYTYTTGDFDVSDVNDCTYDGKEHPATVTPKADHGIAQVDYTVEYKKDGETDSKPDAPKDAGTYTVIIKKGNTEIEGPSFTIEPKAPGKDDFTVTLPDGVKEDAEASQKQATAEVKKDSLLNENGVTIDYSYRKVNEDGSKTTVDAPTDAGKYEYVATIKSTNPNVSSGEVSWPFTIDKKAEQPGGDSGNKPGDGGNTDPTPKPEEKPDRKMKIDGGIVEVNGKEVKPDEDGNITVKEGDEITITFDKSTLSDAQVFDQWTIKPDSVLNEIDPKSEKISFKMPAETVTVEAMTRDATIESDGPGILGTGAMIATVGISAAALAYQGHMLGTEFALRYMLPEWALIPQNRAELAVLLWQDADSPEPVSTNLYSDISEDDSAVQKAARWAVENDLMELLDAEEAPENFDPFVPVTYLDSIHAWKKAQELKK